MKLSNPLLDFYRSLPHDGFLSLHRAPRDPVKIRAAFDAVGAPWPPWMTDADLHLGLAVHIARQYAVWRWALSVPTPRAIGVLVKHSPLLEIGAGLGYWAHLAAEAGADIVAFDLDPLGAGAPGPPEYMVEAPRWPPYFPVRAGGTEQAALHPDRTLFLCWPPYNDPMAADCLRLYTGSTVIYVGEWGGCTADDQFHDTLERDWEELEHVALPQWDGPHDALWVYQRKGESK